MKKVKQKTSICINLFLINSTSISLYRDSCIEVRVVVSAASSPYKQVQLFGAEIERIGFRIDRSLT